MASYYYLVASLPTLFLDEEPPITPAEFMAACDQWLDADDARDIHCLMDNHSACANPGSAKGFAEARASDFAKATPDTTPDTTADRPEYIKGACANQWLARETEIRNALARLRAAKVRVDAEPFLRPCRELDLYTEKAVAEAMSRPQPLERELGLDQLRWSLLDDLSRFDPFGLPAVIAYALKLKLVERWSALTVEKGRAVVEEYLTKQLTEMAV